MCRWLGFSGSPIGFDELLLKPAHSLVDQSRNARRGAATTNGDGFGAGWYDGGGVTAIYRSVQPAWNDLNLSGFSGQVRSGLVFAHIRASTGTPVQQTNRHPFRYGKWLWMHNGAISDFRTVKRDLAFAANSQQAIAWKQNERVRRLPEPRTGPLRGHRLEVLNRSKLPE